MNCFSPSRIAPERFGDEPRVPAHWRTVGARGSVLTGSPRKAVTPAHALLNYLYAIVEAEARLAALAVGVIRGLGLLHADLRSRDSLACDLMEPVRPLVDRYVWETLSGQAFRREDFFETREGVCRVLPPLTTLLAQTASRWAKAVAPVAERVAQQLVDRTASGEASQRDRRSFTLPTPLTEAKRQAGRRALRERAGRCGHCASGTVGHRLPDVWRRTHVREACGLRRLRPSHGGGHGQGA